MIIASCRNADDPGDNRKDWRDGGFRWEWWGGDGPIKLPPEGYGHALVLVHGFNSEPSAVGAAYRQIADAVEYFFPAENVLGFSWPSEGRANPIAYYKDFFTHAKPAALALNEVVRQLRIQCGYSSVSIICHSMGSVVVGECLRIARPGLIHRVAIHGGDAARSSWTENGLYGFHALKTNGIASYWSKSDVVLNVWAKFVRPVARIGEGPAPANIPMNMRGVNAEEIGGPGIGHDGYRKSPPILRHTAEWLVSTGV